MLPRMGRQNYSIENCCQRVQDKLRLLGFEKLHEGQWGLKRSKYRSERKTVVMEARLGKVFSAVLRSLNPLGVKWK